MKGDNYHSVAICVYQAKAEHQSMPRGALVLFYFNQCDSILTCKCYINLKSFIIVVKIQPFPPYLSFTSIFLWKLFCLLRVLTSCQFKYSQGNRECFLATILTSCSWNQVLSPGVVLQTPAEEAQVAMEQRKLWNRQISNLCFTLRFQLTYIAVLSASNALP